MPEPQYLHSLAQIATFAETTVAGVQAILNDIGAKPTLVLNLTPYYSAEVCGCVIARARGWTNQPPYYKRFDREITGE